MLSKLLEAMGHELVIEARPVPNDLMLLAGERGAAIRRQRRAVVALATRHGLRDPRVVLGFRMTVARASASDDAVTRTVRLS